MNILKECKDIAILVGDTSLFSINPALLFTNRITADEIYKIREEASRVAAVNKSAVSVDRLTEKYGVMPVISTIYFYSEGELSEDDKSYLFGIIKEGITDEDNPLKDISSEEILDRNIGKLVLSFMESKIREEGMSGTASGEKLKTVV